EDVRGLHVLELRTVRAAEGDPEVRRSHVDWALEPPQGLLDLRELLVVPGRPRPPDRQSRARALGEDPGGSLLEPYLNRVQICLTVVEVVPIDGHDDLGTAVGARHEFEFVAEFVHSEPADALLTDRQAT